MGQSSVQFLYLILALWVTAANADIQKIAEIGDPAADFAADFTYWDVGSPVIGANGHIAFVGTTVSTTQEQQDAVWWGTPGQFTTLIREGESPTGFSPSTVFDYAFPNTNSIAVSDSGSVAFAAQMAGSNPGSAYLASVNGTTYGVIQIGAHAEGFPAGTLVQNLGGFAFSDAGMAITGSTNTTLPALWFWDNSTLDLILAFGDDFAPLYPGCSVGTIQLNDLNQSGEMLFFTSLLPSNDTVTCPVWVLATWNQGVFREIVAYNDRIPGLPLTARVNSLISLSLGHRINDNGDVSFTAAILDLQQPVTGYLRGSWIAHKGGSIEPVALIGEELTTPSGETIIYVSNSVANAQGNSITWALTSANSETLLTGPSKESFSYPDFSILGESHLTQLTHSDFQPPGFDPTWYFSRIGAPTINNLESLVFWGVALDALNPLTSHTSGIWMGDTAGNLDLLVAEGVPIEIDGFMETLVTVSPLTTEDAKNNALQATSTNSGLPMVLNDRDELVFEGAIEGHSLGDFPSAIFYYSPFTPDPGCSGDVVTIPLTIYPSGTEIYCVGQTSLATTEGVEQSTQVQDGASVYYQAPLVILNPGFSVEYGGLFSAVTPP